MTHAIDATLLTELHRLENLISTNERESIEARWDSGRRILAFYPSGKKQLAKGVLDAIAKELRVHRSEVGARVKCAKKYPSKAELSTIIESSRSWSAIKQEALTDKPRSKQSKTTKIERAFRLVEDIDSAILDMRDLPTIETFIEHLQRLASAIVILKAA